MKKYCILLLGVLFVSCNVVSASSQFSDTTKDVFKQLRHKGVKIYTNDALDIQQPTRIIPSTGSIKNSNTGLQYWLDRLPYKQDKTGSRYLVVPRLGIITPIVDISPSSPQYTLVFKGLSIDFNEYLQLGIVHYPSVYGGQRGNMIVAGHSSYWKKDSGRYKNIFLTLPLLEYGDQIRVYEKNTKGLFDRFVYYVDRSFETTPFDVAILKQTRTSRLTLFTCVPIGTVKSRWVIQAKMAAKMRTLIPKK